MGKVFVVQDDGGKNLSSAMEHGELVALSSRDLPLYQNPRHVLEKLDFALRPFDVKSDHLLLIGDPLLIGACIHYVARNNNGEVPCLKWDRQRHRYFPLTLNL